MTNYVKLTREFNTLRDLRRSALLQTLDAQELEESHTVSLELPAETPETRRANKYYSILDRTVTDIRNLLIEEFGVTDMKSIYDL